MSRYRNSKRVKQPCRVAINQHGIVSFFAPENEDFWTEFSEKWSGQNRVYDQDRKVWKIPENALSEMVELLEKHYRKVEGLENLYQSPWDVLKITQDAPLEMVRIAAKTLRTKYHPDRIQSETWESLFPEASSLVDAKAQATDLLQEVAEAERLILESLESD